jgi:hypothetical protein
VKKAISSIVVVLLVAFFGIQLIRPQLTNPPVTADLKAPERVKQILQNSCYSCHSNETSLPWYDQLAPAYWLVTTDVKQGREHLNFSHFDKLPAAQQKGALFESINQIQLGAMPPERYKAVHPGSAVTAAQLAVLKEYVTRPAPNAGTASPIAAGGTKRVDGQASQSDQPLTVRPAPNGIEFPLGYKDWKTISSTERFDNHTMREILGNDVAIQAIAKNEINPWPDGTVFAKVAWSEAPEEAGVVRAGDFKQVEFMIKDSKKYAATAGWGWARWVGANLQPYGKSPGFSRECVSCHTPVSQNDYVYTTPMKGQQ